MKKSARPMGELALIEQIRRDFGHPHGRHVVLGIGDDCAILRPPAGRGILVTTDLSLENRHFRRDLHPPESVGHRCLARGLSDLAAMGATPLAAFLSLALPASLLASPEGRRWVNGFFRGLRKLADRYHVPLAGGDTSESPRETPGDQGLILADIVLLGSAPTGKALRRSGGRAGDNLYVTGHLGGAAAELGDILSQNTGAPANRVSPSSEARTTFPSRHPHLFPEPRIAIGQSLLKRSLASACIDLSDGLSTDLAHLCRASGVHADIDQAALPIHPLARKLTPEAALHAALHGGEDYELLFSTPANARVPKSVAGIPITRIGRLTRKRPSNPLLTLIAPNGIRAPLKPAGWQHFSSAAKPEVGVESRVRRPFVRQL